MPYYKSICDIQDIHEKERIVDKLLELRKDLSENIPDKTMTGTLLIATWNIREFKSGNRLTESYHYIAEIIARFDLVAIQEVAFDLSALETVVTLLGTNWNYVYTDCTEGAAGGNERMAFLFDTNKITFKNLAGEIVLSNENLIDNKLQFARTPFIVAFQAGWFNFILTTVHIYYGKESGEGYARRVKEIGSIASFLTKRSKKEKQSYILLGDFNINNTDDETMKALEDNGFYIPNNIKKKPTNIEETKHYDQIAFRVQERENMQIFDKNEEKRKAGAYNYFNKLFTKNDFDVYKKYFDGKYLKEKSDEELKKYYLSKWRTFQISDHFPLWVELKIDFSDEFLNGITSNK